MYLGGLANTVSLFGGTTGGGRLYSGDGSGGDAPTCLRAPFTAGAHTRQFYSGGGAHAAAAAELSDVDGGIAASEVVALS